jgi:hypothetical protein
MVFAIRRPMTLRMLLAERSTALLADSGLPRVSNGVVFWWNRGGFHGQ